MYDRLRYRNPEIKSGDYDMDVDDYKHDKMRLHEILKRGYPPTNRPLTKKRVE